MTPPLLATTPSLSRKPYNATLGNDATLGDNNAKLGDNAAMPLLTTMAMTMTMTATLSAVAAAVARTTKTAAVTYRQQSTKRDGQSTIN
jgi:hypothetical protein